MFETLYNIEIDLFNIILYPIGNAIFYNYLTIFTTIASALFTIGLVKFIVKLF